MRVLFFFYLRLKKKTDEGQLKQMSEVPENLFFFFFFFFFFFLGGGGAYKKKKKKKKKKNPKRYSTLDMHFS